MLLRSMIASHVYGTASCVGSVGFLPTSAAKLNRSRRLRTAHTLRSSLAAFELSSCHSVSRHYQIRLKLFVPTSDSHFQNSMRPPSALLIATLALCTLPAHGVECKARRSAHQLSSRKLAQDGDENSNEYESTAAESSDNREVVEDTSEAPYVAIGPLVSRLGDTQLMGCTGSLIRSDIVLTAAHCLLNVESGQEISSSEFAPGYNSRQDPPAPYGVAKMLEFKVPQSFRACGSGSYSECHRQNDFAVIKLDTAFDVWLDFGYDDQNYGQETINTAGYPGDLDNCFNRDQGSECNQYHVSCTDDSIQPGSLYVVSDCMAFSGQSGSPMWLFFSDTQTRQIRGVLAAKLVGSGGGSFTLITQEVYNEIRDAIDSWQA